MYCNFIFRDAIRFFKKIWIISILVIVFAKHEVFHGRFYERFTINVITIYVDDQVSLQL
jgi:hypothetical protein